MTKPIYFPGLNAIRAYAALSVVIYHLGRVPSDWNFVAEPSSSAIGMLFLSGWDSVTFFFVLSGFLITYLLLAEKQQTGTVDVSAFYRRRILRIWPLYFLIVSVGLIILPTITSATYPVTIAFSDVLLILFMLPNIPFVFVPLGVLAPLWSIGVEEQFYLLWPVLTKYRRVIVRTIGMVILIKLVGYLVAPEPLYRILLYARFECMAIGAFAAWLLFTHQSILKTLYHPMMQIASIIAILSAAISNGFTSPGYSVGISVIFAIFIVNIASNPRSLLKLENTVTNTLGKVSYGIYMYHTTVIYLLLVAGIRDVMLYVLTIGLIIIVALLSYTYYEKPFLRLKDQFARVSASPTPQ